MNCYQLLIISKKIFDSPTDWGVYKLQKVVIHHIHYLNLKVSVTSCIEWGSFFVDQTSALILILFCILLWRTTFAPGYKINYDECKLKWWFWQADELQVIESRNICDVSQLTSPATPFELAFDLFRTRFILFFKNTTKNNFLLIKSFSLTKKNQKKLIKTWLKQFLCLPVSINVIRSKNCL